MKRFFGLVMLLASFSAAGQSADRDKTISGFAKDLAALQAQVQAANARRAMLAAEPGAAGLHGDVAVLKDAAVAHSAPSDASATIATVPEGSKVRVVGDKGQWAGIVLNSGQGDAQVGWVSKGAVQQADLTAAYSSLADVALDAIVKQAKALVDRYRNNPWVKISGFSTEVGLTDISLSVEFEFK